METFACSIVLPPTQIGVTSAIVIPGVSPISTFTLADAEQLFASVTVTEYSVAVVSCGVVMELVVALLLHE